MTPDSERILSLYRDLREPLIRMARLYVRDRMVAEDLVADSFVRFSRAVPTLPEDTKLEAYLVTIVKNQCLNHLKATQVHKAAEGEMKDHQQRLAAEGIRALNALDPEKLFTSEINQIVAATMEKMDPVTRKIFAESRYSGKTYNEIAAQLGLSPRRVHTEIEKALKLLRAALSDYLPAWLITFYLEHLLN